MPVSGESGRGEGRRSDTGLKSWVFDLGEGPRSLGERGQELPSDTETPMSLDDYDLPLPPYLTRTDPTSYLSPPFPSPPHPTRRVTVEGDTTTLSLFRVLRLKVEPEGLGILPHK